jgi:hypothetical protein
MLLCIGVQILWNGVSSLLGSLVMAFTGDSEPVAYHRRPLERLNRLFMKEAA